MKKRVLFVDEDQERNGSTVSLEYLVRGFRDRGYDVDVLTWKFRPRDGAALRQSANLIDGRRGPVTTITLCVHFAYSMSPFSWQGIRNILKDVVKFVAGFLIVRRVIRTLRPDIVYTNEYSVVQASVASRSAGIPAVTHIRSPLLRGKFGVRRRLISRFVLGNNARIFAITRQEAEQLSPSPAQRSRIQVVGEFVPPPPSRPAAQKRLRAAFSLPLRTTVVSMLGGIKPFKGTIDFLRAAQVLRDRSGRIVFVIAGSDLKEGTEEIRAYFHDCMQLAAPLRDLGAVVMAGEIMNPLELVAASDIVVSPSPQPHFSRPVIEAWSFARPVIAARTPHMEECMVDGVNGLLFQPGDHQELAQCIGRLARDPRLRARLGREGRKRVREDFDAKKNLDTIVRQCDELIGL
jgi:glycosyltransferase involved in cell wall biosynthesis